MRYDDTPDPRLRLREAPALKGTPKQVKWATSIRSDLTGRLILTLSAACAAYKDVSLRLAARRQADQIVRDVLSHVQASWWITRRASAPLDLVGPPPAEKPRNPISWSRTLRSAKPAGPARGER